ncbi:MAG: VWA domain-containing protein [Nitrospiraceae bacterium]|nr:VWA domain-containing protein [Nitrospiraceae bacterium]
MIDQLVSFADALREAKVPVSMTEVVDATSAVRALGEIDRPTFRTALFATMIKDEGHREVFDLLFDVFFANRHPTSSRDEEPERGEGGEVPPSEAQQLGGGGGGADELRRMMIEAMLAGDMARLARLARAAVARHGGLEKGRAVSGVYYAYRTLKQLDVEMVYAKLREELAGTEGEGAIGEAILATHVEQLVAELRQAIEAEVRRMLVEDRGEEAVARTLRPLLPEDIDFMQASRDEIQKIRHAIGPLARKLATRLAKRRMSRRKGPLDFRRTFRESLGYGGVPVKLEFRPPRLSKPEIFIIADISGSVAAFARFTLQLVYALSEEFKKVRSFVFIDAIDEVTGYFESAGSVEEALKLVNTRANVVHVDGHTNYGHSFEQFRENYLPQLSKKSTVIVLGDARNNYHASRADLLGEIRSRASRLYWLNPEPASYWNSGDSVINEYSRYCDAVVECRNLRQLEAFIELIG